MNYDLAKKLKDAGFPQLLNERLDLKENRTHEGTIYYPTLSELIEACGREFGSLVRGNLGHEWVAHRGGHSEWLIGKGSTPEEAVAHLWLALNK